MTARGQYGQRTSMGEVMYASEGVGSVWLLGS